VKALIRKDKVNGYWKARFDNKHEWFRTFEAADLWARKEVKRWYKESAAYACLTGLRINQLTCREAEFYDKLYLNKCKGITKAQYGYLRGIHERQQREW
jgi:hypothetical protein